MLCFGVTHLRPPPFFEFCFKSFYPFVRLALSHRRVSFQLSSRPVSQLKKQPLVEHSLCLRDIAGVSAEVPPILLCSMRWLHIVLLIDLDNNETMCVGCVRFKCIYFYHNRLFVFICVRVCMC